jgi:hypothetical protein
MMPRWLGLVFFLVLPLGAETPESSSMTVTTPAPVKLAPAGPESLVPAAIRLKLDAEYPGWILAPVSAALRQRFQKKPLGHPPQLVGGDFDRDGKKDYAVQIALTNIGEEEQIVIAFLQRDDGFEETILESRGLNPSVYLKTRREPSVSGSALSNASLPRDVLIVAGGELGESVYPFEGGGFHEAPRATGEVPETLDAVPPSREDL